MIAFLFRSEAPMGFVGQAENKPQQYAWQTTKIQVYGLTPIDCKVMEWLANLHLTLRLATECKVMERLTNMYVNFKTSHVV